MKSAALAGCLALVTSMVLGAAYFALDVFLLGRVDPKWGGAWDNFAFVMQLHTISVVFSTVVLVGAGAFFGRHALASRKSKWAAAVVIAIATLVIWPPKALYAELMAVLVGALGLFGAGFVAFLEARRQAQDSEERAGIDAPS